MYDRCKEYFLIFQKQPHLRLQKNRLKVCLKSKNSAIQPSPWACKADRTKLLADITTGKEKMISLLTIWINFGRIHINSNKKGIGRYKLFCKRSNSQAFIGSNYLKPDVVVQHNSDSKKVYIIDTKWKRPSQSSSLNLRQMYAYNRFWKAKKAMLLYPESRNNMFNHLKRKTFSWTMTRQRRLHIYANLVLWVFLMKTTNWYYRWQVLDLLERILANSFKSPQNSSTYPLSSTALFPKNFLFLGIFFLLVIHKYLSI